jgi:hypothetical protein
MNQVQTNKTLLAANSEDKRKDKLDAPVPEIQRNLSKHEEHKSADLLDFKTNPDKLKRPPRDPDDSWPQPKRQENPQP